MDPHYIPRLYGRRQDKPLKPRQARLMDELLPRVALGFSKDDGFSTQEDALNAKKIWLEIGFGGGEHLAWQARQHPDVTMIGAEPFINGVAKLLTEIDEAALSNVKVHHGDARPLMEALPDECLARLFVLHPDPWPKKRHHKRRMVSPWFFTQAARLLRPGGELRIASDIPDYIRWSLMYGEQCAEFEWAAECAADWRLRPQDWPQTRYEAKAIKEGRVPTYLVYHRL